MRDYVIATESNADLDSAFVKEHDICVIPHYYTLDDEMYGEEKELTPHEFYEEMRAGKKAGTMASNPAVILDRFEKIAGEGKDILFISFSSALSSGINNIKNGADEVMEAHPEMKIVVIDTLSASACEAMMIKKAVAMRGEGKTLDETADWIKEHVKYLCALFTVEDLQYLYRGGRLSKSSAVLGGMINIKPILHINDEGKLVPLEKVRGRKKSLAVLLDHMAEQLGSFKDQQIMPSVIHGDCEEDANAIAQMMKERFGFEDVHVGQIGPSIGAHSGPGTIGLLFLGEKR
ncbi:MAG: DegV family protein [Lachnospiraceae bacterium]|nr:DegV family protein [Lachnospiraceae bacterium]MDE7238365.1 DegV family protein [Lachnospiraceae bacterium]